MGKIVKSSSKLCFASAPNAILATPVFMGLSRRSVLLVPSGKIITVLLRPKWA